MQRSFSINNSILIKIKKFFDFYFLRYQSVKIYFMLKYKQKRLFKINNIRKQDFAHKYQQNMKLKILLIFTNYI